MALIPDPLVQQLDAREQRRTDAYDFRSYRWIALELQNEPRPTKLFWDVFKNLWPHGTPRQFSSKIGFSSEVLGLLWLRYGPELIERDIAPTELMMTVSWLATNQTMDNLGIDWRIPKSSAHKIVKRVLFELYDLLDEISWNGRVWHPQEFVPQPGNLFENVTFAVDGTECGIARPTYKAAEEAYHSTKAGEHTIKYEVATQISSGRIMWISGSVPGSIHDKTVLDMFELCVHIPPGELGLADKGYAGARTDKLLTMLKPQNPNQVDPNGFYNTPTFSIEERLYNRCISAIRIEIERVNGRLKRFQVLVHTRTRNKFEHLAMFTVVANLVNMWNEVCPLRKELHPLLLDCPALIPPRARPPEE